MNLTDLELDVLKEAFNMGAGRAAASLEELVSDHREINLSVPEVEIISINDLDSAVCGDGNQEFSGVVQRFTGPFGGSAVLLYSESESLELVRALLGQDIPLSDLPVIRAEALREIGNIVLNSTLGGISQLLEIELDTQLPELYHGTAREIFVQGAGYQTSDTLLYLRMRFSLSDSDLDGHIGFSLEVGDEHSLKDCLSGYLAKAFGV